MTTKTEMSAHVLSVLREWELEPVQPHEDSLANEYFKHGFVTQRRLVDRLTQDLSCLPSTAQTLVQEHIAAKTIKSLSFAWDASSQTEKNIVFVKIASEGRYSRFSGLVEEMHHDD